MFFQNSDRLHLTLPPPHRFPRAHGTEAFGLFSFCSLDDLFVRVAQSKTGSALCRLSRPLKVYCT